MTDPIQIEAQVLDLLERGVRLEARGDRLHVDAPRRLLTLEDAAFLVASKQEILALLHGLQTVHMTGQELGLHLLEQADKAAVAAQKAAPNQAAREWARWARLWAAAMQSMGIEASHIPWDDFAAQFAPEPEGQGEE